ARGAGARLHGRDVPDRPLARPARGAGRHGLPRGARRARRGLPQEPPVAARCSAEPRPDRHRPAGRGFLHLRRCRSPDERQPGLLRAAAARHRRGDRTRRRPRPGRGAQVHPLQLRGLDGRGRGGVEPAEALVRRPGAGARLRAAARLSTRASPWAAGPAKLALMSAIVKLASRRSLLGAGLALGASSLAAPALATIAPPRQLSLVNLHTGEKLSAAFWEAGSYVPDALSAIAKVLRDHRTGEVHPIDPKLLDLLAQLSARLDSQRPFEVISGYRSPATNAKLHAR